MTLVDPTLFPLADRHGVPRREICSWTLLLVIALTLASLCHQMKVNHYYYYDDFAQKQSCAF